MLYLLMFFSARLWQIVRDFRSLACLCKQCCFGMAGLLWLLHLLALCASSLSCLLGPLDPNDPRSQDLLTIFFSILKSQLFWDQKSSGARTHSQPRRCTLREVLCPGWRIMIWRAGGGVNPVIGLSYPINID